MKGIKAKATIVIDAIIKPIAMMGSAFIFTSAFQPACNAAANKTAKNTSIDIRVKPLETFAQRYKDTKKHYGIRSD
jgi:hypothetical protein